VRETLRLALEELARGLADSERPDFWGLFWERYVESKLDYKSGIEVLKNKQQQAGQHGLRLLRWLEPMAAELRYGQPVELLREVFAQQYLVRAAEAQAVKEHAPGVIRTPHDPDAQWSAKGRGKEKKKLDWLQSAGSREPAPRGRLQPRALYYFDRHPKSHRQ
jgi:hypothetical protein